MAPLFGQQQRQKVQEDTNPSQQTSNGSAADGSHYGTNCMSASSGIHHHHQHHSHSSNGNGHQNQYQRHSTSSSVPPPLPPLRPSAAGPSQGSNGKSNDGTPTGGQSTLSSTSSTNQSSQPIRKYLVLVHDVICIKFAPLVNGHQSHPYPFAFNNKNNVGNNHNNGAINVDDEDDPLLSHRHHHHHQSRVSSSGCNGAPKCGSASIVNETKSGLGNHNSSTATSSHHHNNHFPNHNNGDPQQAFHHHHKSGHHHSRLEQLHFLQTASSGGGAGTLNRASIHSGGDFLGSSSTAEVDHSLHALYLYKGFKEANVQCHWNAALSETFRNIQYKGYIVPSTILIAALPKFLSILRAAWTRQLLRSPAGYRIEFVGEIEEVIADPIQKGTFSPLSDSLCWIILELTSLGQEAFVDSIMSALQVAFPTMSCPSRELVYQTLEKLIRERKVYQTSRGYFVVTPDIFRYMVSANFHEFSDGVPSNFGNGQQGMTLDALLSPTYPDTDKLSFSHQSWDSAVSTGDHNRCSSTSTGEDMIEIAPSPKLKRHNSLKMIRQRDLAVTQMSGSTGQRRHSLRLPKSKSCGRMDLDEEVKTAKAKSSTMEHISRAMRSLRTATTTTTTTSASSDGGNAGDSEKAKKNKSLLSKLFPFRRSTSKPRSEKITSASETTTAAVSATTTTASANSGSTSSSSSASDGSMSSPPTKTKDQRENQNSENAHRDSAKFISTQTQTSNSTEQLCLPSITLSTSSSSAAASASPPHNPVTSSTPIPPPPINACSTAESEKSNPGRILSVDSSSGGADQCSVDILLNHHHPHHHNNLHHPYQDRISGDGSHQTRSSSRRSMSILDESPLYDVLQDVPSQSSSNVPGGNSIHHHHHNHNHHPHHHVHHGLGISPNFQVGCPVQHPTFPGYHPTRESSRCSTLSSQAASSLGYGSQGHPSLSSNYSPNNMDSGLASSSSYGYYGGDGSIISQSHSPCGTTSSSGQYGYANGSSGNNNNGNNGAAFPQPAKPNAYSSTSRPATLYKSSYEWYKKRYPNYISPVGRSSPLYASLTAPRSKSRSRPTYESLLTPMESLSKNGGGGGLVQVSENGHNSGKDGKIDQDVMITKRNNGGVNSNESTTTVTQAVKSTTNMELELLLPLGKIMKAALHAKKDAIRDAWLRDELGPGYTQYANRNQNKENNKSNQTQREHEQQTCSNNNDENNDDQPIRVNLDNSGAKLRVGEPSTETEVTTTVNNNGVIETHFDTSSINMPLSEIIAPMQSTVEIKTMGGVTDVVLVNGRTGQETKILSAGAPGNKADEVRKMQKKDENRRVSSSAYERFLDKRFEKIGEDCNGNGTSNGGGGANNNAVKDDGIKVC